MDVGRGARTSHADDPAPARGPRRRVRAGIGVARSGVGAAITGSSDQVLAKLRAYADLGIESFILSGYPLDDEA